MTLHRGWTTAIVCASGPSFTPDQQALVIEARTRGLCNVIAVNNQCFHVPNADALYASDGKWFDHYLDDVYSSGFAGELWTQDDVAAKRYGLRHVMAIRGDYLPVETDRITQGSNSGHAAIQLAARFGATRILLAGFDMSAGGNHNHARHAPPLGNGNASAWLPRFTPLADTLAAAGIDVINASPGTALTCFRRAPLDVALGPLQSIPARTAVAQEA